LVKKTWSVFAPALPEVLETVGAKVALAPLAITSAPPLPLPKPQTPLAQRKPPQSASTEQDLPRPHKAQVPPPQSTSVSLPSLMPSLQVVVTQTGLEVAAAQ